MDESTTFALSTLAVVVGLGILLFGVSLTDGQTPNTPMIAGGLVILSGLAALTAGIIGLDEEHPGDEDHAGDEGHAREI